MYKSTHEFEQGVVKLLKGIMDGKVKFEDFSGVFDDKDEYRDAAHFAFHNQLLIGIVCTEPSGAFRFESDKHLNPRLSYSGLKFLEQFDKD